MEMPVQNYSIIRPVLRTECNLCVGVFEACEAKLVFFYASKELYQNNEHFPVIAFSNMPNLLKGFGAV